MAHNQTPPSTPGNQTPQGTPQSPPEDQIMHYLAAAANGGPINANQVQVQVLNSQAANLNTHVPSVSPDTPESAGNADGAADGIAESSIKIVDEHNEQEFTFQKKKFFFNII